MFGRIDTAVNGSHHQAVRDVGRLRVSCRARDGVIEGVEADDGRAGLAVQCHPEDRSGAERGRNSFRPRDAFG